MKIKNSFIPLILIVLSMQSCLKDSTYLDVSNTAPLVEFSFGNLPGVASSLGALPDTAIFDTVIAINLASPQVLDVSDTVIIKFDTTLITAFNNANPTNQLNTIPDSLGIFPKLDTLIIPPGYRIRKLPITLYPSKIDPTKSYGLPYRIVSSKLSNGQSTLISGNGGSILYSFIGNILAGTYNWDFTRYNNNTGTGTPSGASFTGHTLSAQVDNPTTIELTSGYYTGTARYVLSFTDSSGIPTNFNVAFNTQDVANIFTANSIAVTQQPVIITADPINNIYTFQYIVENNTPAYRYCIDKYYK